MKDNIVKNKSIDFAIEAVRLYRTLISKMSIALKEANEADYWLELLYRTDFITEETFHNFKCKSKELIKLLVTIVKNAKK